MGRGRNLIGAANFVWVLVACLGAVLFFGGVLNLGVRLGMRSGQEAVVALSFPVSVFLGLVLWPPVLGVVWRLRRAYLQRSATKVSGTVVESSYRLLHRANWFDQHRVRVEVAFVHPETGVDHRLWKEYMFTQFRGGRAKSLQARLPEGAAMPMLVRGRSGAFDLPERPAWLHIW